MRCGTPPRLIATNRPIVAANTGKVGFQEGKKRVPGRKQACHLIQIPTPFPGLPTQKKRVRGKPEKGAEGLAEPGTYFRCRLIPIFASILLRFFIS